jgi:hypothetical protein
MFKNQLIDMTQTAFKQHNATENTHVQDDQKLELWISTSTIDTRYLLLMTSEHAQWKDYEILSAVYIIWI